MRHPHILFVSPLLALGLLAGGCGGKSHIVAKLAGAAPAPAHRPKARPKPTPAPTPSPSALSVAGDVKFDDHSPEVVAMAAGATGGARTPRLRLEVRHRPEGSSQADSVLVFFNVPAATGVYPLHAPEDPPVPGRVYAYFTSRGAAVGSMKDFNTGVIGELRLSKPSDDVLVGAFQFGAQEPPPPPPPPPTPGQPAVVGTIPPAPPAHVQATGKLLARLADLQTADETAQF